MPNAPVSVIARPVGPLAGCVRAPGAKSISHRAVIFGLFAVGETKMTHPDHGTATSLPSLMGGLGGRIG